MCVNKDNNRFVLCWQFDNLPPRILIILQSIYRRHFPHFATADGFPVSIRRIFFTLWQRKLKRSDSFENHYLLFPLSPRIQCFVLAVSHEYWVDVITFWLPLIFIVSKSMEEQSLVWWHHYGYGVRLGANSHSRRTPVAHTKLDDAFTCAHYDIGVETRRHNL